MISYHSSKWTYSLVESNLAQNCRSAPEEADHVETPQQEQARHSDVSLLAHWWWLRSDAQSSPPQAPWPL